MSILTIFSFSSFSSLSFHSTFCALSPAASSPSLLLATQYVIKTAVRKRDGELFDAVYPYIFLLGMVLFLVTETHFLNRGLQRGEVLTVFPTFQAFFIGFGVIGGMVFYQVLSYCGCRVWVWV